MAVRERRVRSMSCDARALRAPQDQVEYRGRLFFGDFLLATQKKVTAPRHERLVAHANASSIRPFDKLSANGGGRSFGLDSRRRGNDDVQAYGRDTRVARNPSPGYHVANARRAP